MNHFAQETEKTPAQEGDSFRRLVESEISPDEYVETLERRVSEQRKNGGEGDTPPAEQRDD